MSLPELKINQKGHITDINGKKVEFTVGKYVTLSQSNYPKKIFVLEEIFFETGKKEIRICYYIIGKKPKRKGEWVFGQFCPFLPKQDLKKLLEKAKRKEII